MGTKELERPLYPGTGWLHAVFLSKERWVLIEKFGQAGRASWSMLTENDGRESLNTKTFPRIKYGNEKKITKFNSRHIILDLFLSHQLGMV